MHPPCSDTLQHPGTPSHTLSQPLRGLPRPCNASLMLTQPGHMTCTGREPGFWVLGFEFWILGFGVGDDAMTNAQLDPRPSSPHYSLDLLANSRTYVAPPTHCAKSLRSSYTGLYPQTRNDFTPCVGGLTWVRELASKSSE